MRRGGHCHGTVTESLLNQKDALRLLAEFLEFARANDLEAVAAATGGNSDKRAMWFMRRSVSVRLSSADEQQYREVVEALYAGIGKARRKHLTRKTVEALVQSAIVDVLDAESPKSPKDAAAALAKELNAPPSTWDV